MYGILEANKQKLCMQEMLMQLVYCATNKNMTKSYKIERIKTNRKKGVARGAIFPNVRSFRLEKNLPKACQIYALLFGNIFSSRLKEF